MRNNYVYEFQDGLYLNITNRCPNKCEFCLRNVKKGVNGSELWLLKEPTYQELVDDISLFSLSKYREVVFCGFGEPTCNLSIMQQIGPYLKKKGCTVRLNTNGLGNLINRRDDVAHLIASYVDHVSISLNASTREVYQEICRSKYGEAAFDGTLQFVRDCVKEGIEVTLSVVDFIGEEEIEACRVLTQSLGANFKVRETIYEDTEY